MTGTIFAWTGIGKPVIELIDALDRPVAVACIPIVVATVIAICTLVNVISSLVDPRVRAGGRCARSSPATGCWPAPNGA